MGYVFNLVTLSSGNPSLEIKNNNLGPYILLAHKGIVWISLISVIFEEYLATQTHEVKIFRISWDSYVPRYYLQIWRSQDTILMNVNSIHMIHSSLVRYQCKIAWNMGKMYFSNRKIKMFSISLGKASLPLLLMSFTVFHYTFFSSYKLLWAVSLIPLGSNDYFFVKISQIIITT